jgi:hypothetical protein
MYDKNLEMIQPLVQELTGIIIPVLKKASLDPNVLNNHRPITLSPVLSKMLYILL